MLVALLLNLCRLTSADVVVETKTGPIRGVNSLVDGVEAYLGIPYAEPPVGQLRFAKPVPKSKWNETYDAAILPPPCAQISTPEHYLNADISNMSEDCLYLNIWAPKFKSSRGLRPVIIYIHGGAFSLGTSNVKYLDGSKLAKRGDLIIATINYRLGAFGFFTAFIEDAAGNMGMHDQIMAIQWLQDNVKFFGGDSENIVLMGNSAGAYSIAAHIVSPLSKNLFKKVILHSGSVWNPFFDDNNNRLIKSSQSVASSTGCANQTFTLKSDPHKVVDCLKSMPTEGIIEAEMKFQNVFPVGFYPRIKDDFLPESSINLFRKGKFRRDIAVLTGITRDEGTIFLTLGFPQYFGLYGKDNVQSLTKKRVLALIRPMLLLFNQTNVTEISDYYTSHVKDRTSTGYTKMFAGILGDFAVKCNVFFTSNVLSLKGNPVYFYRFSFRSASTPMAEWTGSTHMDELQYVLGNPFHKNFTPEEQDLSHELMDRWSAFAWTGNPNIPGHIPWLRYSYHNPLYLSIEQEEGSIRLNPAETCKIWKKRFNAEIDAPLIRFLRNSGLNITMEEIA